MNTKELRQKKKEELRALFLENKEKLKALRFNLASAKVKNVKEIRKIRKNIARILTIAKEQ